MAIDDVMRQRLTTLIEDGLTFGACVNVFGEQDGVERQTYIGAAKDEYQDEGRIEIDDNAIISKSEDGGAYVMAWVWVEARDAGAADGVEL